MSVTWSAWERVSHRVAIAGVVLDTPSRPLRRFELRVVGPGKAPSGGRWIGRDVQPRSLWIRDDGTFLLFDLKAGGYRLEARGEAPLTREGLRSPEAIAVKVPEHQRGNFDVSRVVLELAP